MLLLKQNDCPANIAWLIPGLPENALIIRSTVMPAVNDIIKTVCDYYDVDAVAVKSVSRRRELVKARMIISWLLLRYTKLSLKQIGGIFSGRDHSTIVYARNAIDDNLDIERRLYKKPYTHQINEIKELLGVHD